MDVIYSAQFKRHLSTCRERGDPWAVDMSNAQGRMAARCKEWTTQLPQLMRRFTEQNQDNIVKMHRLYQMAAAYASASLKKSMSHDNVTPVLQPPPGYFTDGTEIH